MNRVQYILYHKNISTEINEPLGWREDEKTFARHKEYHGIFSELSNDLTFIDESALLISEIYKNYGINAEITLERKIRHPRTDVWEQDYIGTLDLSEYQYNNGKVSVKFNSSGLLTLIKSRQNEKVEVERLDTLDGNAISNLETKYLFIEGRKVFLISQLQKSYGWDNYSFTSADGGTWKKVWMCPINIPLTDFYDENVGICSYPEMGAMTSTGSYGLTAHPNNLLYVDSPVNKTIRLKIDIKQGLGFTSRHARDNHYELYAKFKLNLYRFSDGSSFNNPELLFNFGEKFVKHNDSTTTSDYFEYIGQIDVDLLDGQSLAIGYEVEFTNENGVPLSIVITQSYNWLKFYSNDVRLNYTIYEDTFSDPTYSKSIMIFELGDRLTKIIGGNGLKSEYLGRIENGYLQNGEASMTALAHGHWIRNFQNSDLYKKFTTNLKEYIESVDVIYPIGLSVKKIGQKEYLQIEKRDYYYQKFVGIKLGKVRDIKRSVAKEYYYSGIEVGYEKPNGDNLYEEQMGLDEYNTKTTLTTCITRLENRLQLLSKYRADSYGIEFARRKQVTTAPTEDTRFDTDVFFFDVETSGTNLRVSKWSDDLDSLPTGVYSPETTFNLMFSPMRILKRHGRWIKGAFLKYLNEFIRYSSSLGNSQLKTIKNAIETLENGNILNRDLDKASYIPEWIEMYVDLDFDTKKTIKGKTNGIENYYGLVEFTNEFNETDRGYLYEFKENDGYIKLLKNGF